MKKTWYTIILMTFALMTVSCDVNKKDSGELPEVDVDVEEGDLPNYEVNWADIDVGTKTKTVNVPKLVVVTEEEEIEVPVIDVDMPNEEKIERSIIVETEVTGKEHDLDIVEVRATDRNLYVIATLTPLEQDLGDQKVRVQDQIELNAPDLNVKRIIIGEKADREYNRSNMYVSSRDELSQTVKDATVIYKE